jgi:hypothetical protein
MRYHSTVLDESGFEADIDTYLDSDEYQTAFGETIVPYYRGYRNTVRLVAQVILFAPLHPRPSMCGRRRIPTRTRASPILGDFHKSGSPKVGGWGA